MKLNLLLLLFIFFSKFSFATEKIVDPNLIHKNLRCLEVSGEESPLKARINSTPEIK